jgi:membrane protease YdiL (CAAX protease family)
MTEDTAPQKTVSRMRWSIHLFLIGGYFALAIPFAVMPAPHRPELLTRTSGLFALSAIQMVLFFIIYLVAWLFSRASGEELLLRWRPGWWVIPLGLAYSIALRLAAGILVLIALLALSLTHIVSGESLTHAFSERPPIEKVIDPSAMQANSGYFWLTLTFVSFVVAGLREELWRAGTLAGMRGLWPNLFSGRQGEIAAVALIAIVFGLAHLPLGLIMAAMASGIGFFLGIIMIVHRSIWPAVIAHGMFDATTFALLPWLEHFRQLH